MDERNSKSNDLSDHEDVTQSLCSLGRLDLAGRLSRSGLNETSFSASPSREIFKKLVECRAWLIWKVSSLTIVTYSSYSHPTCPCHLRESETLSVEMRHHRHGYFSRPREDIDPLSTIGKVRSRVQNAYFSCCHSSRFVDIHCHKAETSAYHRSFSWPLSSARGKWTRNSTTFEYGRSTSNSRHQPS